ncbi:Glutamyl-tRNA(Gln) amidotransferase subunit C [Symmachiella dynata]|uniref:Aspartyl/glutamyl-tRNA(Asn/Gln) amidotransferase subunit C n=1 Tax=Symmachiella dynata TaxID=2527995 RepID=A0A517ZSY7_9PLAN|nr:Asp-tRNA(Asn)/Glu-tRNA(Gln) amidotransferase subunit GatC [Symmachiella dynata]QDT49892.1 Glutamyl-tRNA(Gln) amidotransferase subunit C [Symmachiella dynata]QDU45607.1 Glutamyl-tRNA(Gln) amidotransferase subunit C [Symmachiella dynata]
MTTELTRDEIQRVAVLARLKLSDAELDSLTSELAQILGHMDQLNELDTEDVEPMVHAIELKNVFRADEVHESLPRDEALANAPKSDGRYFQVPQILEGS